MFFCLSVFAFLCRAFIPVGYMPDASSERQSPFAITLCTMGGSTLVQLDFGAESDTSHDQHYSDSCPYGLSVAYKLMPGADAPAPVQAASFYSVTHPVRQQAMPPLPALGPPLGSRAPPLISASLQA